MWESGEVSGYFWLRCLVEAAVTSRSECCRICFQTAHSLTWLFQGLRSSPTGALHRAAHMAAGFPQIQEKSRAGSLSALCNLIPEGHAITSVVFYWLHRPILEHEDYRKLWIPGSRDQWCPSWRLATTKHTLDLSYITWNSSLVSRITYLLGFSASRVFLSLIHLIH